MSTLSIGLLIVLLGLYIGSVIWIFQDSRKRQDELATVWSFLALISFPIVLIIYIIVTRTNKENYDCNNCGFKVKENWKFCPNCNQELKNNLSEGSKGSMTEEISIKRPIGFLPISVFIMGIVLFALFLTFSLININNSFTKLTLPGVTKINLKDKGEYTIFYEYNNKVEASENYSKVKNMDITIKDMNTNNKVAIFNSETSSNYSFGGVEGRDVFKFNVEEPGNYELSANSKDSADNKITISIAHDFMGKILLTVFGSLVIMFGAILSGVFIIIRRNKTT